MIINNVTLVDTNELISLRIEGANIVEIVKGLLPDKDAALPPFSDAIIFPAIINSHDHLDFNLFPALGNRTYENYVDWGKHIHQNYPDEIAAVLKVPLILRESWGIYKNLLCGVGTVVNHGRKSSLSQNIVTVLEYNTTQSLHSVRLERYWKLKLNNLLNIGKSVSIHIGEGTNADAGEEIEELIRWNLLQRELIGIHGVALSKVQAKHFKALIWCPESNYFLLGKTADIKALKAYTKIAFGSDSTLTGRWNMWDHLRMARATKQLSDIELYQSTNANAADIWGLHKGKITKGMEADLVIADAKGSKDGMTAFFNTHPATILMVIHQGKIKLIDDDIKSQIKGFNGSGFHKIWVDGACKHVKGDLPALVNRIRQFYPTAHFPISLSK